MVNYILEQQISVVSKLCAIDIQDYGLRTCQMIVITLCFFFIPTAVLKLFSKSLGRIKPNMAEMILGLIIMFLIGKGKAMKYSETNIVI